MTEKTLTTENIKPALDALRGELAPWPVVAKKQDRLNAAQLNAANSGITSSLVAQIIANTAAIRALESAITGTGLRALVVSSLPAVGTTGILYIVPVTTYDPETDADVVNYSNEYIWIPVEGGTASEGHYEQVGQTGIVINNGQLTITVNGTSVGTFTANQSGDTTAAITVPTNADYVDKTTDQTVAGDKTWTGEQSFTLPIVGSITGTASKAIADEDGTSIKTGYVNVAGTQSVSGNKEFTGSNTFNNILPNATNTYSLGTSSYQWKSVYAQSYYYNGVAWGLDQNNTWTGANSFYKSIQIHGNRNAYIMPEFSASYSGLAFGTVEFKQSFKFGDWVDNNSVIGLNTSNAYVEIYAGLDSSDGVNKARLNPVNATVAELGTSTNKWKTLNGINPGALSLPDCSVYTNIDRTDWVYDGGITQNLIKLNSADTVITSNGWLYIRINDTVAGDYFGVRLGGSTEYNPTSIFGESGIGHIDAFVPVVQGFTARFFSTKSPTYFKFYPCLGNV